MSFLDYLELLIIHYYINIQQLNHGSKTHTWELWHFVHPTDTFGKFPRVFYSPTLHKLNRCYEDGSLYQWKVLMFEKATFQYMQVKPRRRDMLFLCLSLTWSILCSWTCWVRLRRSSGSIILWAVSPFHAEKKCSLVSLLACSLLRYIKLCTLTMAPLTSADNDTAILERKVNTFRSGLSYTRPI